MSPAARSPGSVVETDPGTGFEVGDRVGSIVFWGGLAPLAVAAPEYTVKLPDEVPDEAGAATYLNYSTAWYAYHRARVQPGQTVLVHGAAGGVGTAALDLAPAFGAKRHRGGLVRGKGQIGRSFRCLADHPVGRALAR